MKINKTIALIFILTILTNIGFSQSQKSFDKLILETNDYLKVYDTLYAGPNHNYLLNDIKKWLLNLL